MLHNSDNLTNEQLITVLNNNEKSEILNLNNNSFSKILELSLLSDLDKYYIQLNPELILILTNLIKTNPDYFNSIEITILDILNNNKTINIENLPIIITLLKDLYKILYNLNIKNIYYTELILGFVINILLIYNINNEIERNEIFKKFNTIIITCTDLIDFRKVLKNNKKNLISCCLFNIF
jgi:hypothetical protein